MNGLLKFVRLGLRKSSRGTVTRKKMGSDHVHPFVGALRGKDGRDQELEGRLKIQFAMRVGINLRKRLNELLSALRLGHGLRL